MLADKRARSATKATRTRVDRNDERIGRSLIRYHAVDNSPRVARHS
jgi:hypothetical protein